MKVEQALVAIGGSANRLRADGVEVPITKSFLPVAERPLLFWSLSSLALAGVRRIVLAGNQKQYQQYAERVLDSLPYDFEDVRFFQDQGLGVHGLPWHTRHLLDEQFIFECGHGISKSSHYQKMDAIRQAGNVVFSAFASHPENPRQPVMLEQNRAVLASQGTSTGLAVAHPFLIDQGYAQKLPELDFNIRSIIRYYSEADSLQYVLNKMPPEFDTVSELAVVEEAVRAAFTP